MNPAAISERQAAILAYIERFQRERGYTPTIREIGRGVAIASTSVVSYNLNRLLRMGYLEKTPGISRGIRLRAPAPANQIPLVDQILTDWKTLPVRSGLQIKVDDAVIARAGAGQVYGVSVASHDWLDALVNAGDVLVIEACRRVAPGQLAAVLLRDRQQIKLRQVQALGGLIQLKPLLPALQPQYFTLQEIQIVGRVLAVIRQL